MRSRINSTGRQKIGAQMAMFSVIKKEDGTAEFSADIDLSELSLPADGEVFVEAYRQSIHERFSFGSVRAIFPQQATVLRELDADDVSFRVKVVEPGTGRLLARGDRFGAAETGEIGRQELLKVLEKDLGQDLWRTEIHDEERKPILALNNRIPNAANLLKTDLRFQACILPAALRQVLMMLWIAGEEDDEDEQRWQTQWIRFAQNLIDREKPDWNDKDDVYRWIDDVCGAFSARYFFTDRLVAEEQNA